MSPREHDPAVRDLFSGDDTLHEQLARLDRSEPPEELDRIVIERARQAIRTPQPERPIRQFRWAVPLAVAATLVISFALVVHQVSPPPSATPPADANTEPALKANAPLAAKARVDEASELSAYDAAEVHAPASPPVAAVPQRAPPSSTTLAAPSSAASRAAEGLESTPRTRAAPAAALAKQELFEGPTLANRPELEAKSARSASKAAAASDAAASVSTQGEAQADFRSDPDAWMAYIGRLRHVGRSEEADRELAAFRRVFPHYKYAAPPRAPAERPAEAIAPDR